MYAYK
jgi:hypothetical protein